jgi:NAD(P)H-dependent flavin oxidoreductase YrpB (nitropropane dioxygenase family)
MAFQTALTKRLGLRYPVIAAPLGRGSTPQFLAALAREGAMGFVALMHMPEQYDRHFRPTSPRPVQVIVLASI